MIEARIMYKPKSLQDVLRDIRTNRGFSQRKWAKEIYGEQDETTHIQIAMIEKGKIQMPQSYIRDLFGVVMLTEIEKNEIKDALLNHILEG